MKKKLVFFFPWKEVSGGPYYLARIADAVAQNEDYDVYYTDYPRGLCNSIITEKSVKILKYRDEGAKFEIFPLEPVILVMPIYWAHMVPVIHKDTKIVFFNWHNECIPVLQRDWCVGDSFLDKFLHFIQSRNSVFFCDKTHWMAQNRNDIIFKELYVPVVIPKRKDEARKEIVNKQTRNIAIFGRLCLDKIYAVIDVIDNIIDLRDGKKTNIFVIGDGDYAYLLDQCQFPSHIKVIRCGMMEINKAITLLKNKVDILFAMGTAALDGATIKLPTVIIPNKTEEFECNRYPYLYETTGYALGWYPEQIDELNINTHTMEEILDDIYEKNKKGEIGALCYDYYLKNHSDNRNLFLEAIETSTLYGRDYFLFLKDNFSKMQKIRWLRQKFQIFYGTVYKRYCLFGIPLLTITKPNHIYTNIYVLFIPLFRIKSINAVKSFHILPIVWAYKALLRGSKLLCNKIKKNNSWEAKE